MLEIVAGEFRFAGRLEEEAAPATVAAFRRLLPLESRIQAPITIIAISTSHE